MSTKNKEIVEKVKATLAEAAALKGSFSRLAMSFLALPVRFTGRDGYQIGGKREFD